MCACACVSVFVFSEVSSVYRLRSEGVAVSVLHAGRELEVGDTNIVVTTVQENVGLRKRWAQRGTLSRVNV